MTVQSAGLPKIYAPWSDEQVIALNKYQEGEWFHPFTCRESHTPLNEVKLHATRAGWECSRAPICAYSQLWAWEFMSQEKPS